MEKQRITEKRIKLIREAVSRILGDPVVETIMGQEKYLGWAPPLDKPYISYRHAFATYLITPNQANNEDVIEFFKIEVPKGHENSPWIKEAAEAVYKILQDNNELPLDISLSIFERAEDGSVKCAGYRNL